MDFPFHGRLLSLKAFVESSLNYFHLLLSGQSVEMHSVSGNPYCEGRIFFGMVHRLEQCLPVHYIHIQMMRSLTEISVKNPGEVAFSIFFIFAKSRWHYRKSIRYSVFANISVWNLRHRIERCQASAFVSSVHRIGSGSESFAHFSSIRCGSRFFSVDNIRCYCQYRKRMLCIPVSLMSFQFIRKLL